MNEESLYSPERKRQISSLFSQLQLEEPSRDDTPVFPISFSSPTFSKLEPIVPPLSSISTHNLSDNEFDTGLSSFTDAEVPFSFDISPSFDRKLGLSLDDTNDMVTPFAGDRARPPSSPSFEDFNLDLYLNSMDKSTEKRTPQKHNSFDINQLPDFDTVCSTIAGTNLPSSLRHRSSIGLIAAEINPIEAGQKLSDREDPDFRLSDEQKSKKLLRTPKKKVTSTPHRFSRVRKSPLKANQPNTLPASKSDEVSSLFFEDLPITPKKAKRTKSKAKKNKTCQVDGCTKNARGTTGFCVKHGGGKRCHFEGCTKGARPFSSFCSAHGGGRRCAENGCNKGALNKSKYCRRHGKGNEGEEFEAEK